MGTGLKALKATCKTAARNAQPNWEQQYGKNMSCAILQLVIGHKGNFDNSCQKCTTELKTIQISAQVVRMMIGHKNYFVRLLVDKIDDN